MKFAWPAPCSFSSPRATGPRGGAWMAKQKRALPIRKPRDRSRDDESLLLRSAESLGRVIGSLQRQLDGATKRLSATASDAWEAIPSLPEMERATRRGTKKRTAA